MFQGQRLSYIVPGYTGHQPKKVYDDGVAVERKTGTSHIPGYAGYVHSIKPENIHASTFGKITYDVNNNNYVKGQDLQAQHKYISTQTCTNIPPSEMLSRTAANIVGINDKKLTVRAPKLEEKKGKEVDQFTLTKDEKFRESMKNQPNKWADNKIMEKEGKKYVALNNPLPGYTGFAKRVMANNIYGKTFAECRHESLNDADKLDHDRKNNFNAQLELDPPLR